MESILNFARVSPLLATAGQPSREQLAAAKRAGVTHVVRLSTLESGLPDEDVVASGLGLNYLHIPVVWTNPSERDLQRFFVAMAERSAHHTLVHCAKNYRVSVFVALYHLYAGLWDAEKAWAWVYGVWEPNEVWAEFYKKRGAKNP